MAFRLSERTARLRFEEGTVLAGAEVVCRLDIPLGVFLEFQRLAGAGNDPATFERAIRMFAETVLISWDLEDDDGPVPATFEGMQRLPVQAVTGIITAWMEAVQSPPLASGGQSESGGTSEEQTA
jgi:hypothetical protein